MKNLPKWILVLAVSSLVVGTFVAVSHGNLPLIFGLAMPLGFIFAGLFLITLALQNEAVKFDEDERLKMESAERHGYPVNGKQHTKKPSGTPGNVKAMDRKSSTPQPIKIGGGTL